MFYSYSSQIIRYPFKFLRSGQALCVLEMLLGFKFKVTPFTDHRIRSSINRFPVVTAKSIITVQCNLNNSTSLQKSIGKLREKINGKVEISPSAYDTAWVAMVPSREHSRSKPCFPQCLDWILENQNPDGSWGLQYPGHPYLVKDSLSCTLACLLALRKWNVGEQLVQKGLDFIRSNAWAVSDKDQLTPIGFDIVFPLMIKYANELDLALPFNEDLLDSMFRNRDSQIKRNKNLEYVAEGLGESFKWKNILTKQRSNGSLFNSPATTAAALIHYQDNKSFEYLDNVLKVFETWVPTTYPVDIYTRLFMVDTLERRGIDRYFQSKIDSILEEMYRSWQEKEEEIFADVTCCAMAFRILRMKGYEVSSDELAPYADQEHFFNTISLQSTTVVTMVLELYRASQVRIHEEESTLEKLHSWTSTFLKQQVQNKSVLDKQLQEQFELMNYHGMLDRVGTRRTLKLYDVDHYQILKAAYRCPVTNNEDLLLFARQDFDICQAQHRKELNILERWYYTDCKLGNLKYGRNVLNVSHFLTSAILADPQLSDARVSFAKTIILATRLDDFFDHHGSREESLKIIELIKEWNKPSATTFISEEVEILFAALYNTVNELDAKAYVQQGRHIKPLLIHMWIELLTSSMREMDTFTFGTAPSMDEYLSFAWISVSCKICILTSIHFLGIKLSEDVIMSSECTSLCKHVSLFVRLLNDIQTFKKEQEERKLNSVSLQQVATKGAISEEEAISKIRKMVEHHRRKLLKLILNTKGSVVPKECKQVFWGSGKIGYYLYFFGDEFTSPQQIMEDMKSVIYEPFNLPQL